MLVIVDAVSRKYFTSETSWLWDIDFDQLSCPPGPAGDPLRPVLQRFGGAALLHRAAGGDMVRPAGHRRRCQELAESGSEDVYVVTCFSDRDKILAHGKGGHVRWNCGSFISIPT